MELKKQLEDEDERGVMQQSVLKIAAASDTIPAVSYTYTKLMF